ncbi:hypothetical protein GH714_030988 [Hevea brasiliensis]|uniref:Uncharacterized protein n=1 Tax=Hevea brasiliensis TaxID=3981 RepID=A0A6A6LWM0_HEVBR|nr:hypothetical protein GH714_030988 [Hevea brasiliensis]
MHVSSENVSPVHDKVLDSSSSQCKSHLNEELMKIGEADVADNGFEESVAHSLKMAGATSLMSVPKTKIPASWSTIGPACGNFSYGGLFLDSSGCHHIILSLSLIADGLEALVVAELLRGGSVQLRLLGLSRGSCSIFVVALELLLICVDFLLFSCYRTLFLVCRTENYFMSEPAVRVYRRDCNKTESAPGSSNLWGSVSFKD